MRVLLVVILLAVLAGGGGYYYYFISEPQSYVKAVLDWKKDADERGKILTKADIDSRVDYTGVLEILDERKMFLSDAREEFSKIPLPYFADEFRGFREDYLNTLSGYELANDDAEARAKLLVGFSDLGILVNPDEKPPFDEKTGYIRDLQNYFEKAFVGLKRAMNEPSSGDEPNLNGEIDWKELKLLWIETRPAVDITLNFIRAQDSNAKLVGYEPRGQTRVFQEASDKVTKFGESLKKVLDSNTSYDILAYRYFEGFDEKVSKPQDRANAALNTLRVRYPDNK